MRESPNSLASANHSSSSSRVLESADTSIQGYNLEPGQKKLRRHKQKKDTSIQAEQVDNYVGDKDIDDLLEFIGNGPSHSEGKKNKKNQPSAKDVPVSKTSEKVSKKNKKEKPKIPNQNNKLIEVGIGVERSDNNCSITNVEDVLVSDHHHCRNGELVNNLSVTDSVVIFVESDSEPVESGEIIMGNTTTHTSHEDTPTILNNDISDTTCDKKDMKSANKNNMKGATGKSKNDKLAENDKLDLVKDEISVKNNKKKINNLQVAAETVNTVINSKLSDKGAKVSNTINHTMETQASVTKNNNTDKPAVAKATKKVTKDNFTEEVFHKDTTCAMSVNINQEKMSREIDSLDLVDLHEPYNKQSDLFSQHFYFTDIDLPVKEAEFQVVGKKKKKGVINAPVSKDAHSANNYFKDTHIPTTPKFFTNRVDKPRRPLQRSVTPPPQSCNTLSTEDTESERIRDLSPSSFPALHSSSPSSSRDGRRSSTGDVPTPRDLSLKVLDDSDLESVKSMPAASQGKVKGQEVTSPRLAISYATMAASPSPKPSNTSIASSHSEGVDAEEMSLDGKEWKSANWKGSLTERRHSIGSHQDVNVAKEIELSPSMKQKYGSQETLSKPVIMDQFEDTTVTFLSEEDILSVSNDMENRIVNSKCSNIVAMDTPMNVFPQMESSNKCSVSNSSVAIASSSSNSSDLSSVSNSNTSKQTTKKRHSKVPNNPISGASVKLPVPNKQSSCNNKKTHKNKSVIFLDKKFNENPSNLGISFGFDSTIVNSADSCVPVTFTGSSGLSFIEDDSSVMNNTDISNPSSMPVLSSPQPVVPSAKKGTTPEPPTMKVPTSVKNGMITSKVDKLVYVSPVKNNTNIDRPVAMVGPLMSDAIVADRETTCDTKCSESLSSEKHRITNPAPYNKETVTQINEQPTPEALPASVDNQSDSTSPLQEQHEPSLPSNHILVHYGNLCPHTDNGTRTICFERESTVIKGRFNLPETARYICRGR